MLKSPESSFPPHISSGEHGRRRSTFYVPLITTTTKILQSPSSPPPPPPSQTETKLTQKSLQIDDGYNPDLSACSFEWSLNCSDIQTEDDSTTTTTNTVASKTALKNKRYGVVLDGSISARESSTPISITKSRSRSNILNLPDKSLTLTSPMKEKSKTLPQNLNSSQLNAFPPKNSFLLKSTPKMSLNYSSDSSTLSPRKSSLSFIRRAHSTKLTRNNSLLKSLTTKCVDQSIESVHTIVNELSFDRLAKNWGHDKFDEIIKEIFFKKSVSSDSDLDVSSINGRDITKNPNGIGDAIENSKDDDGDDDEENAAHSGEFFI